MRHVFVMELATAAHAKGGLASCVAHAALPGALVAAAGLADGLGAPSAGTGRAVVVAAVAGGADGDRRGARRAGKKPG
jgi:hypothetical protein